MKKFIANLLPFGLVNWYLNKKKNAYIAKLVVERKKQLKHLSEQVNQTKPAGNYINFGCGKNYQKGWVNIDSENNGDINLSFVTDSVLPFDSGSMDGVFSEHFIEHIDLQTGIRFMSESYRVLKPGGVLRIVCPNLDYILSGISQEQTDHLKKMFISVGDFNREPSDILDAEIINWIFYGHGHKFIYNFEGMYKLLTSIGFSSVKQVSFGVSSTSIIAIERRETESFYSLYVEAIK